jgi:hydrogenase-4 membrane subunit HyfE
MHWSYSPFIIPVAAFAMVLGIVIVANISNYHNRRLKSEERMAAIAKGIPLPPENDLSTLVDVAAKASTISGQDRARGLRTGGIVLASIGVGLALLGFCLDWILQERDVLAVSAAGLIPLVIGIGLIVDYALRNRTFRHEGD